MLFHQTIQVVHHADQSDEVNELQGGRVYFTSTDQDGDFRVGDLFRIQQATGIAALNADAFDLSGLNELQLEFYWCSRKVRQLMNLVQMKVLQVIQTLLYQQKDFSELYSKRPNGHRTSCTTAGTTVERPTGGTLFTGGIRYNTSLTTGKVITVQYGLV